jgi:hypothetical protein
MSKILCFSILFFVPSLFAAREPVEVCTLDHHAQNKILKIAPEARLNVFNEKKEIVGAFKFDPASGEIYNLYLCGANAGHYYAEGNIFKKMISSVYNDEYDSTVTVSEVGSQLKIELLDVTFAGEPEDADYPPFSATLYVDIPKK